MVIYFGHVIYHSARVPMVTYTMPGICMSYDYLQGNPDMRMYMWQGQHGTTSVALAS